VDVGATVAATGEVDGAKVGIPTFGNGVGQRLRGCQAHELDWAVLEFPAGRLVEVIQAVPALGIPADRGGVDHGGDGSGGGGGVNVAERNFVETARFPPT